MTRTVAAIDCGTNSTRLLVARSVDGGGYETIERLMTITRLGQDVDRTGRLADEAIERVLACLREYKAANWGALRQLEVLDDCDRRELQLEARNGDRSFEVEIEVRSASVETLEGRVERRLFALGFYLAAYPADLGTGHLLLVFLGAGHATCEPGIAGFLMIRCALGPVHAVFGERAVPARGAAVKAVPGVVQEGRLLGRV